jgi:hypothetical protein
MLAIVCTAPLQAQTCNDWKSVVGWQGTYTLTSSGTFVHNMINQFSIDETSSAVVSMPTMTGGLCDQLRWQGADESNSGTVQDTTQVLGACMPGEWFTTDKLEGNSGYPSNSELVVNSTGGAFSFQPIPHDFVTHTIYNCMGSQSGQESWATAPATNWPLTFPLPQQVGPLTVSNFPFFAASRYAGYQDISWMISFNLTPILAGYKKLSVVVQGSGSVTSVDGNINCPSICSYYYPPNTQVTLNATAGQGYTFLGWGGACVGPGACNVTMSQDQAVTALFSLPLQFVATTPCRVVDTRGPNGPFGGPVMQGGTQRAFPIPQGGCGIPSQAQAYSLNVTVVPHQPLNYLTIWPTGQSQPLVSTMNSSDGRVKANAAIVPAGTDGAVSVYVTNTTDVILDINGYFMLAGQGTYQFFPLPPCRVIDTRGPNGPFGGPYLSGGVQRDFMVSQSGCVPFFRVVQTVLHGTGGANLLPAVSYRAAEYNRAAVVADFNRDGKADIATANDFTNISVLLSNGNGTFQAPVTYGAGSAPYGIVQGDFNGDGKADLAVANHDSNNVSVLLGNGDGTFHTAVNYAVGTGPRALALADFNGDSKLDLVTANDAQANVSVLLGNGNGTFQAAVSYSTGGAPYSVAVGDFNGDHKVDLVTANYVGNTISVLPGNGNGTFQGPLNTSVGSNPSSVTVADFNQDGKADVAVANYSSNNVSVLMGNGNGTFQAPQNYTTFDKPTSVVSGTIDSIWGDFAVVSGNSTGEVSVFENTGTGTFLAPVNVAVGSFPVSLALGDLNGDGALDITVATEGAGNSVPRAYSLNATVAPHTHGQPLNYLTLWPQGNPRPNVSTLNNPTATVVANAAIVPAGSNGGFVSAYAYNDTDLIVDINGYFTEPAATGLSLYPAVPCRAIDTRNNNGQPFQGVRPFNIGASLCGPPASTQAYVLNATVVPDHGNSMGYLTLWPNGEGMPVVSTLNAYDGKVTSNMAIVPNINGTIDAYADGLTHLILDVSGYFAP